MEYTPENITDLPENGIFVFGSNLAGNHAGGAAKVAKDTFGAIDGVGMGLSGRSYAFATLDREMNRLSYNELFSQRTILYMVAIQHADLAFYLTKIGLGIAGYDISEIAPLFKVTISNIIYPKEFIDYNAN